MQKSKLPHLQLLTSCVTVSKRLGHANISTTTNIYTHILQADKKASDKLENILLNQNKQKQVVLN